MGVTAPKLPGLYRIDWELVAPGATSPLAEGGIQVAVVTDPSSNATITQANIPSVVYGTPPENTVDVKVTVRNTGTVEWTPTSGHGLLASGSNLRVQPVSGITSTVSPGSTVTFDVFFSCGSYGLKSLSLRMQKTGMGPFGQGVSRSFQCRRDRHL
jgi:hypothetical protein